MPVPDLQAPKCNSSVVPTLLHWQKNGTGVYVLEGLTPGQFDQLEKMPGMNTTEGRLKNLLAFNATFYEHYDNHTDTTKIARQRNGY